MRDPITTSVLVLLTLVALAASAIAVRRLVRRGDDPAGERVQALLVGACMLGSAALFLWRWLGVTGQWQPLAAHVDGLLLIAALFAGLVLFVQWRPRLFGLTAFASPLLALILGWAICASAWTYHPFDLQTLHPVWMAVHLAGVYLGTLGSAVAAIAGGMYLYVQRRLKQKADLTAAGAGGGKLASLETLERLIVRSATLGFALLTLGLVSGLVILSAEGAPDWRGHFAWKITLAAGAWLVYALLMNVRYAATFRGARAAWLSIAGLALLLATYAVVTAIPGEVESLESPVLSPESGSAMAAFDSGLKTRDSGRASQEAR